MTGGPVSGATYTIRFATGAILYTAVSDANGTVYFPDIPCGVYYLQETVAPPGYLLNRDIHTLEVGSTFILIDGVPYGSFAPTNCKASPPVTDIYPYPNFIGFSGRGVPGALITGVAANGSTVTTTVGTDGTFFLNTTGIFLTSGTLFDFYQDAPGYCAVSERVSVVVH